MSRSRLTVLGVFKAKMTNLPELGMICGYGDEGVRRKECRQVS